MRTRQPAGEHCGADRGACIGAGKILSAGLSVKNQPEDPVPFLIKRVVASFIYNINRYQKTAGN